MAIKEMEAQASGRGTVDRDTKPDVTPILDYILIHRSDAHLTDGGLYIPSTAVQQTGPVYAEVVAVGPGRPSEWNAAMIPMPRCKVGDTVLYHGGAGTEWEHEGRTYWWILPRDLIGVVG